MVSDRVQVRSPGRGGHLDGLLDSPVGGGAVSINILCWKHDGTNVAANEDKTLWHKAVDCFKAEVTTLMSDRWTPIVCIVVKTALTFHTVTTFLACAANLPF